MIERGIRPSSPLQQPYRLLNLIQLRTAVKKPLTVQFIDAWTRWRGDLVLPRRSDMNLRDIARSLDSVILFEFLGPNDVLLRVAGSRLRELSGLELTGRNYKDLTRPEDWPTRIERIAEMATRPCAGLMTVRYVMANGRRLVYETITLPVAPEAQDGAPQLLACNTLIDGYFELSAVNRSPGIPAVDDFSYVDIGAGRPDNQAARPTSA